MPGTPEGNGWDEWKKWVVTALKQVIRTGDSHTCELRAMKEDLLPRVATLEERVSADKIEALTKGVQDNSVGLAKMSGAGLVGGGVALALTKLAEAIASTVQAGGVP